jgi:prepilin-type N-terminal cleavage/methylation domain-containing protein
LKKAFTLIELLIVVAIIAILAAIAVPNFLEAQTRAKVSRTKSDQRTLATAIEAYRVDNNAGPTDAGNGAGGIWRPYANPPGNRLTDPRPNYSIGFELTTPIAYITSIASLVDPFKVGNLREYEADPNLWGRQFYNFSNIAYRNKAGNVQPFTAYPILAVFMGDWALMGAGPDKYVNNLPGINRDFSSTSIPRGKAYDPTNGTVSNGDVYRSQKFGDGMAERGLP